MWRLQIAVAALVLTAGCALRSGARPDLTDWSRVVSLLPGQDIVLQHVDSPNGTLDPVVVRGQLIAAGPSDISVRTRIGDARIARTAVKRVALVASDPAAKATGTLVGAAIGTILGLGITSRVRGDWENGATEGIRATTTTAGAAAGAWAGALREGRKARLIYQRD